MTERRKYSQRHRDYDMLDSQAETLSSGYQQAEDSTNPKGEAGILQATRVIRINEGSELASLTAYESEFIELKGELKAQLNAKSDQMSQVLDDLTPEDELVIIETLREAGFKTILSIKLSRGLKSGKPMFHVRFPSILMDIDPMIPPSQRVDFGLAVAANLSRKASVR